MPDEPVPVTMGSPRFTTREVNRFLVTHAWFPPGARLEPHVHERPTFALILDGGFDLTFTSPGIRRRRLPSPPGTMFTEPAGERHENVVSRRGASVLVVQPDAAAPSLDRVCSEVLDGINHFRDERVARCGRHLAREVLAPDALTPLAIEALALEMLVRTARVDEGARQDRVLTRWMAHAVEFVHAHFRDKLRIADVAEAAGVHPAHLAAEFRRDRGVPLATYVRRLRVEWAAEQLAHTEQPISRIAIQAGFADQAHLTRMFKAGTGHTPARFRRFHRATGTGSRPGAE